MRICDARLGRHQRGLTLVEIMIAVGIIGVALSGLVAAVPFAIAATRQGQQRSTATFLANQRLEQVRNARWEEGPPAVDALGVSALPDAPPTGGGLTTFPDEATVAGPFGDYARTVRITDCRSGGCGGIAKADLRQVAVTVSYRPLTGTGAISATGTSVTVTTYIAKR